MENATEIWQNWAVFLKKWHLTPLAAFILEGAQPLLAMLAQLAYLGQPFLLQPDARQTLGQVAQTLEVQSQADTFAALLRKAG